MRRRFTNPYRKRSSASLHRRSRWTPCRGRCCSRATWPGHFPYWFDPSRFEPAGAGHVSLAAQWRTMRSNALWFALTGLNLVLLAIIAFAMASRRGSSHWRRSFALLPSLALLGLYALTNPTGRMGGAPIACIVAIVATLAISQTVIGRRPSLFVEYAALGLLTLLLAGRTARRVPTRRRPPRERLRRCDSGHSCKRLGHGIGGWRRRSPVRELLGASRRCALCRRDHSIGYDANPG